jgi:GT2 family glycosyltransferase
VASSLGKVQGWEREVRVPARRLDAILKEMDIQHVTLLKIDVEGAELDLLNGAPATLATSRPAVIFEVNPAAARNTGVPEHAVWDLLAGMGYRFFTVSGTALAPLMRFTAPRQGTVLNVVAIHGEPRDDGSLTKAPHGRGRVFVTGAALVSVVMPAYNAAATIEPALRSLLGQTYEPLEIIVVDDGSSDVTADVAAGLGDPRVMLLRQSHGGLVKALNDGCARAQGEYIARLDADDLSHERRIAAQVAFLSDHPDVGLVGTWAAIRGGDGAEQTLAPPTANEALRRYLLWDNPFVHSSVMFRRAAFQDACGYPEDSNEDYRLWIRIARSWKIGMIPEVLVTHRIRSASLSRTMHRADALLARLRVQWEAVRALGSWYRAIPALGTTAGAYLLARVGGDLESRIRRLVGARSGRWRGLRDVRPRDRTG